MAKGKKKVAAIKRFTIHERLAAMKILENNKMNHSKTARELGVSRQIIYRWEKLYMEEYKSRQEELEKNMVTVEAKKHMLYSNSANISEKSADLMESMIEHFYERDLAEFKKLSGKDKIQLMNVVMPYVLERKGLMGVHEALPSTHNTFFTNIINQLKNNNGDSKSTDKGDSEAVIIE